jgi:radical SAM protein with 4Fe4S-binding SPASM domain
MGQYRPAAVVARGSLVGDAEAERARLRQSFDSEIRHFATHVSAVRDADALGAARSASPWFGEQLGRLKPFFRMPESPLPSSDVRHTMTSCAMGFDQLYVSADGGLHMCHLTDGTVRLGDVSRGLDRSLIAQRFLDSNSSRNNPGCRSCWIVNMCELCAAILSCEGGFRRPSPAECECFRLRVEQAMCNYLTLSDRPELLEAERRRIAAHVEGRVDITRL